MNHKHPNLPSEGVAGKSGARDPNLFSIAPGTPFLPCLVSALIDGKLVEGFCPAEIPECLADATIFVPNRRTARALSVAFLDHSREKAGILPSIRTLGDVEGDEFGITDGITELEELPKVVGPLERQLSLARLVQKWTDSLSKETRRLLGDEDIFIPSSQSDAIRLADELGRLLDQITREESGWDAIRQIIPEEHAQWWSLTGSFLQIIFKYWPDALAANDAIDPAMRSRALLDRRIEHYRKHGSKGPVIIAGSTGSVPSTQRFLNVIAGLENGAVVLPGLDYYLDEAQWNALLSEDAEANTESHPQFGLAKLLSELGVDRSHVIRLGEESATLHERSKLASLALCLPEFSSHWREAVSRFRPDDISSALDEVALIEAANERQEALAIAICLREAIENPEKTAAMVTPDRNLARRVAVELQRFGINVDDSAGTPLSSSPGGRFVRQILLYCTDNARLADIVSLLKSPFLLVGQTEVAAAEIAVAIECRCLRGKIGKPVAGKLHDWAFQNAGISEQEDNRTPADQAMLDHASAVDSAVANFVQLLQAIEPVPLGRLLDELKTTLVRLASNDADEFVLAAIGGIAEFKRLIEETFTSDAQEYPVESRQFPAIMDALMASVTVRSNENTHPRLHIYGPLELRLQNHHRVVIAGLNEGAWPRATRNDAFLNRMMRAQIGLPSPERRTGLAAHDFQQILGHGEVIISRSLRVDRAPSIASRWLQRLLAVAGDDESQKMRSRGQYYLELADLIERDAVKHVRGKRPCPTPPVEARPNTLWVTDIESWIRDPYALYAKRILGLRALDPLEREPDALLRGTLYHAIMEEYVSVRHLKENRSQRKSRLIGIADQRIEREELPKNVKILWRAQFLQMVENLLNWEEAKLIPNLPRHIHKEVSGEAGFSGGSFTLRARADRLDEYSDGRVVVMDYKTGTSPSLREARTLSPQLALEGIIAGRGGFEEVAGNDLEELSFVRLMSGDKFKVQSLGDKKNPLENTLDNATAQLEKLISGFRHPDRGYISRRAVQHGQFAGGDYDHLARTREWSFGEDEDND